MRASSVFCDTFGSCRQACACVSRHKHVSRDSHRRCKYVILDNPHGLGILLLSSELTGPFSVALVSVLWKSCWLRKGFPPFFLRLKMTIVSRFPISYHTAYLAIRVPFSGGRWSFLFSRIRIGKGYMSAWGPNRIWASFLPSRTSSLPPSPHPLSPSIQLLGASSFPSVSACTWQWIGNAWPGKRHGAWRQP